MYIAHFDPKTGKIQEVNTHLQNVAYIASEFGKKLNLSNTLYLAGRIHDMGKFNSSFQDRIMENYIRPHSEEKPTDTLPEEKTDHSVYGGKYIFSKFGGDSTKDEVARTTAEILATVILAHHGGIKDHVTENADIVMLKRFEKIDDSQLDEIISIFEKDNPDFDVEKYFNLACKEIEEAVLLIQRVSAKRNFAYGMLIKTIYSMLIDADRLDCVLFESGVHTIEEISSVMADDETLWQGYCDKLEKYLSDIGRRQPEYSKVNAIRREISDECMEASGREKGIFRLTVPTGGGKTLSSLRFALNHAKKNNMDRIIYVLPFTTIIEQNAQRVREVLGSEHLLEHHSNVVADNEKEDYKLLTERWSEKIIFTTMVQFLNTFYARGTQDMRRMHNLINSIIIFDEVQAIPAKCISLFNEAINFLCNVCKATVVLCSATQPELGTVVSPITGLNENVEIIKNVHEKYQALERVKVINCCEGIGVDYEEAKNFILDKKQELRSLLVVVNKIQSADILYDKLKNETNEDIKLYYLSTTLCPAHRKIVIDNLKKDLAQGVSLICVSTQLIEAGVDISFEGGIRCMAGMDSIAQTSGRVNRNGESEMGKCYVIKIKEESLAYLNDIRLGTIHSEEIFNEYKRNAQRYDNSLLSTEAIKKYYNLYYADKEIKNQMPYPCKNTNIVKMLTNGKANQKDYVEQTNKKYPLVFCFRFKEAADNFNVIENSTQTIVVPFGKGKDFITQMAGDSYSLTISEKREMLSKIKPYCVNVQNYKFKQLFKKEGVIYNETYGVNILVEGYYHEEKGVRLEKDMKTLLY